MPKLHTVHHKMHSLSHFLDNGVAFETNIRFNTPNFYSPCFLIMYLEYQTLYSESNVSGGGKQIQVKV